MENIATPRVADRPALSSSIPLSSDTVGLPDGTYRGTWLGNSIHIAGRVIVLSTVPCSPEPIRVAVVVRFVRATVIAVSSPSALAAATHNLLASLETTGRIPVDALIWVMGEAGHDHLIHYAGAAHRDPVAWHLCAAYLADPQSDEATLKSRALKAAWGWDVSPDAFRAAGAS